MKNITFTTLAVVIVTIFAAASFAEAQTGSGIHWNVTPQASPLSNQILPATNSSYGNGYAGKNCQSGCCGSPGSYGTYGTRTGYRARYGATNGYGLGSAVGSWFGLRPATNSACPNGRCSSPPAVSPYNAGTPYNGVNPYSPSIYPAAGYPGSLNGGFGGNGAYYGNY